MPFPKTLQPPSNFHSDTGIRQHQPVINQTHNFSSQEEGTTVQKTALKIISNNDFWWVTGALIILGIIWLFVARRKNGKIK